jgi:hypothetical protein
MQECYGSESDVSNALRDLIGKEKWALLQKKTEDLEKLSYLVVCETCHKVFFESTLSTVQNMMLKGDWKPKIPQLWYVHAGRHWVAQKFHSIRVYATFGNDKTLIKDLSAEWIQLMKRQKRDGFPIDKAMLNELDKLEKEIKKRI